MSGARPAQRVEPDNLPPPAPAPRRRVLLVLGIGAAATGFAVFALPQLAGAAPEWRRVRDGDVAWLFAAAGAEVLSYAGYVVLLRAVFGRVVGWRDSFLISMAGVAATRLFATAGAGGIVLTTWALRRLGLPAGSVGRGMVAFLAVLYSVYMAVLLVLGVGLGTGLLPGGDMVALTLVPAAFAGVVIGLALLLAWAPDAFERRPLGRLTGIVAGGGEGVRLALMLTARRPATLLPALAWWGFDIAALAAAFHAFGMAPAPTVLVMSYFVGMLGNLLPLPGGVGGVEGGMIGALAAFGEPAGPTVVAVLGYRLVSFWLPTVIGVPAYVALVRRGTQPEDSPTGRRRRRGFPAPSTR